MKPYKSIFKESGGSLEVSDFREALKTVDISDLQWSKITGKMSWDEAVSSCPPEWRLPTIQELYTATREKVPGFSAKTCWSSTVHGENPDRAWFVQSYNGTAGFIAKRAYYYVRYVQER